ncbi:hypothetical protein CHINAEXTREME_17230 [Halobiforma lacisalsi AJ5]|uniref:Uncharacterized protein n=1 Tax=Natronobacterium lacisalsi AJ5 TaxID=358396 RepID=A0A1P8LUF2_NATLA|nr:hypothetical protein [Halobiforma lacisalsi]APW99405.1 hypothetical protein CHINAEXTREME_17230 [Halobiforma lacisalsi AJ5]
MFTTPSGSSGGGGQSYEEAVEEEDEEEEEEQQEGDSGGISVGIPGTDYEVTTSREDADYGMADPDGVRDPVDETLRNASGGDVGLSDDFTSTEDSGGVTNVLSEMDDATADLTDPVLDPVQEVGRTTLAQAPMSAAYSLREGEATWLEDEEVAEGFSQLDEEITETIDEGLEDTRLEDSRVIEGTRWAGDAILGESARIAIGTSTGIDTREGDTDFDVGLAEAGDVALTLGTAGAGGAATRGGRRLADDSDEILDVFRRSDEGDTFLGSLGRSTDEAEDASSAATRADDDALPVPADEAGSAARSTDEAAGGQLSLTDESGDVVDGALRQLFGRGSRNADEAASTTRSADEAASTTRWADEAAESGGRWRNKIDEDAGSTTRSSDDAASATRSADENLSETERVFRQAEQKSGSATRSSDDAARATRSSDEAASATRSSDEGDTLFERARRSLDEAGSRLSNAAPSRRRSLVGGTLGAGAIGAGMLATMDPSDADDVITTEDGHRMVWSQTLRPTEEYPNGGELYRVDDDGGNHVGYWVLLGAQGRNLIVLDSNGDPREAKIEAEQFQEMQSSDPNALQNEGDA